LWSFLPPDLLFYRKHVTRYGSCISFGFGFKLEFLKFEKLFLQDDDLVRVTSSDSKFRSGRPMQPG